MAASRHLVEARTVQHPRHGGHPIRQQRYLR